MTQYADGGECSNKTTTAWPKSIDALQIWLFNETFSVVVDISREVQCNNNEEETRRRRLELDPARARPDKEQASNRRPNPADGGLNTTWPPARRTSAGKRLVYHPNS